MNNVLFICILMIGYLSGQAQAIETSEVPSVVTAALKKEYPYASNVKWETQDGMYEGSFKFKLEDGMYEGSPRIVTTEMSVVYSDKGVLALTETQIEIASLPAGVREYFAKNMMNTSISEASKVVNSQGMVTYEVEVEKIDYLFTGGGKFLRKLADDDDDDQ